VEASWNWRKDLLEQAFEMMDDLAKPNSKVVDIAVHGGSCLPLGGSNYDVTPDVDAMFFSERKTPFQLSLE
jgi:hypothetical protein